MDFRLSRTYREDLKIALNQVVNFENLYHSRIMITGATGLIGSYIVDMLLLANEELNARITIYAVGRSIQRLEQRFHNQQNDQLILIEQDVIEQIACDFEIDYIIHAAGNAYPASFNSDPVGTILSNIVGTYNLLEYGLVHGVKRLLYISSGEVYGQGDTTIESFSEEYTGYVNPLEPRSCYPIGKRAAENLCVSYTKQYSMDTVIVRPSHAYGPNTTESDNRANVQFVKDVLSNRNIVLKSKGTQLRSYTYIPDCSSGILTVLINGRCADAYNIAFKGSRLTIAEFAELIAKIAGKKVVYEIPNERDIEEQSPISRQVLSSEKLEALGWNGLYTPEIGISHLLRSLKGH